MESASPDLRQSLHSAAQRLGLKTFWRWWLGELVPLMPAGLRTKLSRRRLRPIVVFEPDAAVVWAPEVADGALAFAETARVPLSGDPVVIAKEGHAAIDALPRTTFGGVVSEARVLVGLQPSQVLRKTLTFPAAVEENLHQMLAYELDRHTPFKPDEMYFDAVVVGRDPAKKEIRVDWSAALKSVVDQARKRVEGWGAVVVGVTPEAPTGASALAGAKLNLLPAVERPDVSMWRRWQIWVPVLLIGVVAVLATALPLWQKRGYAIVLTKLAEATRTQAEASIALREQLEQLTGDYNFALQRKYAFPAAIQVVDDVSKLLPDDTWLTQFEVKTTARGKDPHREIVIRGESANAGRLVSLLEESKVFTDAAPRSPTTKIQPGPGEIFDLGAQLKPLAPPDMIVLAEPVGRSATPASSVPATSSAPGSAGATPAAQSPAANTTPGSPKPGVAAAAPSPAAATSPAGAPNSAAVADPAAAPVRRARGSAAGQAPSGFGPFPGAATQTPAPPATVPEGEALPDGGAQAPAASPPEATN